MANTERVKITLPAGFDPGRHVKALVKKIADRYGDGFEIDSIDPAQGVAYASRQAAVTEVTATALTPDSFEVRLVRGTKPSDGDRVATKMADQYPGLVMTRFEPFLGKAVLSKLDPATTRCRGAVATALGVKPWDVQALPRIDGGFDLELPSSYVSSKHDAKLEEVATSVVGRVGWYVAVNVAALTASIIPSTPPTFPAAFTYPLTDPVPPFSLTSTDWAKIPLGHVLPAPGVEVGPLFSIDLLAGAHIQVGGVSGGGKAQPLTTRLPVPVSDRFPTGWATVGELEAGDRVFSAEGRPVTVTGFSETVTAPVHEVVFADGQTVRCGGDHLWQVSTSASRSAAGGPVAPAARIRRLRAMADSVPTDAGGDLSSIARLAGLAPGALARMGLPLRHLRAAAPVFAAAGGPAASPAGPATYPVGEVLHAVARRLDGHDRDVVSTAEMRTALSAPTGSPGFAVHCAAAIRPAPGIVLPDTPTQAGLTLGGAGAVSDAIDPAYLRADVAARRELLDSLRRSAGDTRVVGDREDVRIHTTNAVAFASVVELVRSLGLTTTEVSGGAERSVVFRVGDDEEPDSGPDEVGGWHHIVGVTVTDPEPMRCLHVDDPEHLYLTDGFIPTHNSVVINDFIAGALARSAELVVVDLPSKSVDFLWCKKFCRDGGWGCDSLPAAVTALALVMAEGERRARVLAEHHVIKWTDLPPDSDVRPIVVIIDELTGLFYPEKVPKLAKDHPLVIEANEINLQKAILEKFIKRIAAELRFVGVHLLVSSQVASVATGIDPAMRTNLHHKILMGSKPTDGNRRLVLSDPGRVPKVPGNVQADSDASRGTGVAEPEGREPCVFKSFYSDTAGLDAWLLGRGVPTSERPAPTTSEIAQHTPSLDDADTADTGQGGGGFDAGPTIDPRTGEVMTGYARANDARRQLDEAAGTARKKPVEMAQAGPVTVSHREPTAATDG